MVYVFVPRSGIALVSWPQSSKPRRSKVLGAENLVYLSLSGQKPVRLGSGSSIYFLFKKMGTVGYK